MGRFETETLAMPDSQEAALADLNDQWIDRFQVRTWLKYILLDMDSSFSPTQGDPEGSAWNWHYCTCVHPNFFFNQFGMLERYALHNGKVRGADGCRNVLLPVFAR